MKYRIMLIIILSVIFTSIIYTFTIKDQLNVLILGDGLSTGMTSYYVEGYNYNDYLVKYLDEQKKIDNYYSNFNEAGESAKSLLTKINNNALNNNKKIKIKQAIKESDIITISLGIDELNDYARKNNLGSTKINGFLEKYENVLKEIRKLNNKKVIIIGIYKTYLVNENKVTKINKELNNLSTKYNCLFIDITDLAYSLYLPSKNDIYLNYKGQEAIYQKIIAKLEEPTINII